MSVAKVFLDTPVLLSSVDDHDTVRRDQARAWVRHCWTQRCGRLSVPVLNEFYAHARRKFATAIAAGDARAEVRRYQHWKPWQVDHATVETAWAIESRYGLAFADALVVASAQQQGCTALVTDALPHALQIDNVTILDPFRVGPEVLA